MSDGPFIPLNTGRIPPNNNVIPPRDGPTFPVSSEDLTKNEDRNTTIIKYAEKIILDKGVAERQKMADKEGGLAAHEQQAFNDLGNVLRLRGDFSANESGSLYVSRERVNVFYLLAMQDGFFDAKTFFQNYKQYQSIVEFLTRIQYHNFEDSLLKPAVEIGALQFLVRRLGINDQKSSEEILTGIQDYKNTIQNAVSDRPELLSHFDPKKTMDDALFFLQQNYKDYVNDEAERLSRENR